MAQPYSAEPTIRILDKAIYDWLGTFLVDYEIIDDSDKDAPRVLISKKQEPVLRVVASPDRAFAQITDFLVSRKWIDETTDAFSRAKAEYDWAALPLPIATIDRDEPTPNNDLQQPPAAYRTGFLDANGNNIPMPPPLHYVTVYRITFWSKTRYTHSHFMEWLLAQQGLPGAGPQEIWIPVQHDAPWGTIMHSLRYTEAANLSDLEGDGPRYIRTQVAFVLRSWLFRAFPDITASAPPIYSIGATVDPSFDGSVGVYDAIPFQAWATLNLYSNPYLDSDVPLLWPRFGSATVALSEGLGTPTPIQATLTVDDTDRVPLSQKLTTLGLDGNAYLSFAMSYRSTGDFLLTLRSINIDGSNPVVFRRRIFSKTNGEWQNIHMFSSVTGQTFEWSVESVGADCVVDTSNIDVRQVNNIIKIPPTTYSTTSGTTTYLWMNLQQIPYILYCFPTNNTGIVRAYPDQGATPIERDTHLDSAVDLSAGLLSMPIGSTLRLSVNAGLSPSAVFAVPFEGPYLGDIDGSP